MQIIQGLEKCLTAKSHLKKKKNGAMTQLLGHLHREQISGTNAYVNLVGKAR